MQRPEHDLHFTSSFTPSKRDSKYESGTEKSTIDLWLCKDGTFSYTNTYNFDDGMGKNKGSIYKSFDGGYKVIAGEDIGDRLELNVSSGVEQHTFLSNR